MYWERKFEDIKDKIDFIEPGYLFFSSSMLDLPYTFKTDQTLIPVAIGLSKADLIELGYEEIKQENAQSIFIGDKVIPIKLISKILFQSERDESQTRIRYGKYLDLVDSKIIDIANEDEFEIKSSAPARIKGMPKQQLTKDIESGISNTIGAVGNALIELNDNDQNSYSFLFDIISNYLSGVLKGPIEKIKTDLNDFNWNFKNEDIISISLMIVSEWKSELKAQEKDVMKLASSAEIDIKDFDVLKCLVFIRSINTALSNVNNGDGIKNSNRNDILAEIISQFKQDLESAKLKDNSLLEVLKIIEGVFDYKVDPEEMNYAFENIQCAVSKIIFEGFHIFIQEPIKREKLKSYIDRESEVLSEISKVFALFLWGRAQGAFAFEPVSKLKMLERFSEKGFYSICFNLEDLKKFNFSSIKNKRSIPKEDSKTHSHSYGSYNINIVEQERIAYDTYERIIFLINTSTGLNLKEIKKDTYQDVFDKMEVLLKNKKLNKQDFDFFLGRDVPLKFGKKIALDNITNVSISEEENELFIEYNDENSNLEFTMPYNFVHDKLFGRLAEKFSNTRTFEKVSLSEKKKIREYFQSKSKPVTKDDAKAETSESTSKLKKYESMTVKELRSYMKEKNIKPLTGNKEELISRIRSHEAQDAQEEMF